MSYLGVAYYPEAWPRERWSEDIRLMRQADINLVRMGEFSWAWLEPEESRYYLDGWRDICGQCCDADIRILAATPTAAPPAWLSHAYPDVLAVTTEGQTLKHGARRHTCPTSPRYRQLAAQIVQHQANTVCDNPLVIGWQIDNEITPTPCHCEQCAAAFRKWLRDRYGTLEALNTAWGNAFWSGNISAWEQVQPPTHRVSWLLDYRRFQDDQWADFVRQQAELLRQIKPDWRITTNLWAAINPGANVTQLNDCLDVPACDGYWDYYAQRRYYSAVWDMYRNLKTPRSSFWLVETNAWNPDLTVTDGLSALRPWAYEVFAKGASALCYFRWRQSVMGEQDHPAVLDWSGMVGRPYLQVQELFREIQNLPCDLANLPLPEASVGVLYDYDTAVCSDLKQDHYWEFFSHTCMILNDLGQTIDVLPVRPSMSLEGYRLLVLPQLEMVDNWLVKTLQRFVECGGTLLMQTRLGTSDRNGKYHLNALPNDLTDLCGLRVVERGYIRRRDHARVATFNSRTVSASVDLCWNDGSTGQAVEYMEMIDATSNCHTWMTYASGSFAGSPAVIEHPAGQGRVVYQACLMDEPTTKQLLCHLLKQTDLLPAVLLPAGCEVLLRGAYRLYLNHTPQPVTLPMCHPGKQVLGTVEANSVQLSPYGVCIIQEDVDVT